MNPTFITSLGELLQSSKNPWTDPQRLSPIKIDRYRNPPPDAKKAAVMAILFQEKEEWQMLFIIRSTHEKDKHSGQVGFPGGRLEPDESLLQCALRETHEEIGLQESQLTVIGELSELYVYASNFTIKPFVAYTKGPLKLILSKDEVDDIITYPINKLLQPSAIRYKTMKVGNHHLDSVPYYDLGHKVLWGATAILTHELLSYIDDIK